MKKLLAFVLTLAMLVSCFTCVSAASERQYLYKMGYEHFDEGTTASGNSWLMTYGLCGESYLTGTIVKREDNSKYLNLVNETANNWGKFYMCDGDSGYETYDTAVENDFVFETEILIDYGKTLINSFNIELQADTNITANGTAIAYKLTADTWYNLLIKGSYSDSKYNLYMKKTDESEYECVAEGIGYESANFYQWMTSGKGVSSRLCLDNIALYYPEDGFSIPVKGSGESGDEESDTVRKYLYKMGYEHFEEGQTASGSSWLMTYGLCGESYLTGTIVKREDNSKYLNLVNETANNWGKFYMCDGDSGYETYDTAVENDFVFETEILIDYGKTLINSFNIELQADTNITANGTDTGYELKGDTWYNLLIEGSYSDSKYNLYMKKTDESKYECVAEGIGYESANFYQWMTSGKGVSSRLYLDNIALYYPEEGFSVAVKEIFDVSLTVGENGTGSALGQEISDNTVSAEVLEGTEVALTFAPNAGYEVDTVLVNDAPVAVSGNEYTIKVTADTVVSVTFKKIVYADAEILKSATYSAVNTDGTYTITVYSMLNNFEATAENLAKGFGIKLWVKGAEDSVYTLPMLKKTGDDSYEAMTAAPNQAFAIRVYGDAITAEGTYGAKAYIGDAEGDSIEID